MRRLALGAAVVLLLAGCGGSASTTAADQVPALGERLDTVDSFLATHQWGKARAALRGIVAEADAARADGELDAVSADRVVATAARLLAALPAAPKPTATPTPSPTRAVTAPSGTQSSRDVQHGKGDDKGGKKGKGKKH